MGSFLLRSRNLALFLDHKNTRRSWLSFFVNVCYWLLVKWEKKLWVTLPKYIKTNGKTLRMHVKPNGGLVITFCTQTAESYCLLFVHWWHYRKPLDMCENKYLLSSTVISSPFWLHSLLTSVSQTRVGFRIIIQMLNRNPFLREKQK